MNGMGQSQTDHLPTYVCKSSLDSPASGKLRWNSAAFDRTIRTDTSQPSPSQLSAAVPSLSIKS
jgi:hypothetical protein